MVNYNNSKIYKIVSPQTDKIYVGSTTKDKLCQRMAQHRAIYKRYLNDKERDYITSFEILKYEDAIIILIEAFPCNTKDELHARERYWIENTANCVNKFIPTRNKKEYNKYYREKNTEQIKKLKNEKISCICGGRYSRCQKKRHEMTTKHINFITKQ
jgi:hypothetical protein